MIYVGRGNGRGYNSIWTCINAYEAMHKIRSNPVNNRKAELLEKLKRREISYED